MQVDIPFSITYRTPNPVPIDEVIDSLLSAKTVVEEGGNNFSWFFEGLKVERVTVGVRSISQESPLRELFLVSLIVAFQDDLELGVSELVKQLTGEVVPQNLEALVTVIVLVGVFYGVAYVKDLLAESAKNSPVRWPHRGGV